MSKKKLLIHVCCAPCLVAPYEQLLAEDEFEIWAFWYNPNIHPLTENQQRLQTLQEYAAEVGLKLITKDEYNLKEFLRNISFREEQRCRICYHMRLRYAAIVAAKGNFDYYTTTLLYSKFQNHQLIREVGEACGKEQGIKFYYRDFRELWKTGIDRSKELSMYRQQYCGCIYSEYERYSGKRSKDENR